MRTRPFSVLMLLKIFMLTMLFNAVRGLNCYSCVTSQAPSCLSSPQVTCASGQVCGNTVYRRGYSLGLLYTKGCENELQCLRLANLNSATYCDYAPSQCQYCCSQDLCNAGRSGVVKNSRTTDLWFLAAYYLMVKRLSLPYL